MVLLKYIDDSKKYSAGCRDALLEEKGVSGIELYSDSDEERDVVALFKG